MVDIEVRASPPNGTGGKHTEWITKIHLALWKKTHVTCFGWLNMFKQSHRTILDKITFLFFNINFAKGDFVRSTFANIRTTQKFSGYILYMSYCLLIASDPDYITYPSRTRQSNVREKQCFRAVDESHLLRKSRKMRSHEKITWHYFSIIWQRVFWISSGETKFQGDRPDS